MSVTEPSPSLPPVMRSTKYERVSSGMMSITVALVATAATLYVVWMGLWPDPPLRAVPVEIMEEDPGGVEDGVVGEELRVDSPLPEIPDASPSPTDEPPADAPSEIEETLDQVMDLGDEATNSAERQYEFQSDIPGRAGSAKGNGRRGLGSGPGRSGFPREQRWFVTFANESSLTEYAKQLDFFGIELGALSPDGQITYLSNLSTNIAKRTVNSGKGETRLYMTWQGGSRRLADMDLLRKAGVNPSNMTVMQFYPKDIENIMARLELDYANRKANEIRRTYFSIEPEGSGYVFKVARQISLR